MIKKIMLNIAFWCDKYLKWHNCEILDNDDCSNYGICKYCGAKCLQDSQGNWFEIRGCQNETINFRRNKIKRRNEK